MKIKIIELKNKKEILNSHHIFKQNYQNLTPNKFSKMIDEMLSNYNFHFVGIYVNNKLSGVCAYSISMMIYCGKYLQVSSLIVDQEKRCLGIGNKIINFLEDIAKKQKCDKIVLDSYTENKRSHSLYFRNNFYIRGFHFMKDL